MANMVDNAIGLLIAAVVIVGVAIPVIGSTLVTDTEPVTEMFSSDGTLPQELQLSSVEEGVVEGSETVTYYDSTEGTNTTLPETDYSIDYDQGNLTVESIEGATSGVDTGDEYYVDYEFKPRGYLDSPILRTIASNIQVILAIALFLAVFSMVGSGRR